MYRRSQKGLIWVHMGSYLALREPCKDQRGPYLAKGGYWRLVGGPYRTKWGHRDFIRRPKGSIGHP